MTTLDDLLTQTLTVTANLIAIERKLRDSLAGVITMQTQLRTAKDLLLVAIAAEQDSQIAAQLGHTRGGE